MSFPKITNNNFNNGFTKIPMEIKIIKPKNRNQIKKMVDTYTSTNSLDYNNPNNNDQIKIKEYNIILPTIQKKINNHSNINNTKNVGIKSIKNRFKDIKILKKALKNVYNFYHPWSKNSVNNNEINEFMSNCYDITKIDVPINEYKSRINGSKLTNKFLKDMEKHYRIANIFQKKKLNNIKFNNLKIRNKFNNFDTKTNLFIHDKTEDKNNFIFNEYNNFKILKNINNKNKSHSLKNTYLSLSNKNLRKNENHIIKDSSLPKFSSSLNTSYSRNNFLNENFTSNKISQRSFNNDNSMLKNDYKTIKIKKIIKNTINDKCFEERMNRIDKIRSNLLFKKNITSSSLNQDNDTQGRINKSNLIKHPIKIWFK